MPSPILSAHCDFAASFHFDKNCTLSGTSLSNINIHFRITPSARCSSSTSGRLVSFSSIAAHISHIVANARKEAGIAVVIPSKNATASPPVTTTSETTTTIPVAQSTMESILSSYRNVPMPMPKRNHLKIQPLKPQKKRKLSRKRNKSEIHYQSSLLLSFFLFSFVI